MPFELRQQSLPLPGERRNMGDGDACDGALQLGLHRQAVGEMGVHQFRRDGELGGERVRFEPAGRDELAQQRGGAGMGAVLHDSMDGMLED